MPNNTTITHRTPDPFQVIKERDAEIARLNRLLCHHEVEIENLKKVAEEYQRWKTDRDCTLEGLRSDLERVTRQYNAEFEKCTRLLAETGYRPISGHPEFKAMKAELTASANRAYAKWQAAEKELRQIRAIVDPGNLERLRSLAVEMVRIVGAPKEG